VDVDQAWRELEVSTDQVVRLLVRLRNENALLQEKIDQLNRELEELGRDNQIKTGAVERLRSDVKSRVESIMEKVSTLEQHHPYGV
jgi:dynactin complex subunit